MRGGQQTRRHPATVDRPRAEHVLMDGTRIAAYRRDVAIRVLAGIAPEAQTVKITKV